ncbi:MAG: MFS transporter [Actinomycetota bacterium]
MQDTPERPEPEDAPAPAPPARGRFARTVRNVAIDLSPLRASRDYRLLWFGELISETGHQITVVAIFFQLYRITGSAVAVGLVGLVQLVALMLSSIAGGSIIDAVDRRKMLLLTQFGYIVSSGALLAGAVAGHPPVWLIYAAAALTAALSGLDFPTRSAMTPRLVGEERLPAALALNQVLFNITIIVGPAIGGVIIARFGLPWAYGIDLVTYGATIGAAALLKPMPPLETEGGRTRGMAAVREGLAYLKGRRVLQSTFYIDIIAMVFGMPRALFPILAETQFHRGPEILGLLYSSVGVGALIAAMTAGWVSGVHRQGRAVVLAVCLWGAAIAAFGLVGNHLVAALIFLAIAGGADVVSAVFRGTILQLSVPDALRGRLSGIHIMVVTGGPRVGDFEAGLVAQIFTPAISVVSGGLLCVAGAAGLAMAVPAFWRYRAGEET